MPAILRSLVACGWFGIQTWIGGQAIQTMLVTAFPAWEGVPGGAWIAFFAFWLWNMYIVVRGSDSIKFLEAWAAHADWHSFDSINCANQFCLSEG